VTPGGSDGSDLIITVGGDLTPLESALAGIPEAFAGVTSEIEDAFGGLNTVTSDLQNLANAAGEAVAPVETLAEQLDLFGDVPLTTLPEVGQQLEMFATYAGDAASGANTFNNSLNQLPAAESNANSSLLELAASFYLLQQAFQIIKGAIDDLVEAYGNLEKAQLALGSILKDQSAADAAIASTKQLADSLGLAQDSALSAQQKLAAMGIALKDIPGDLTAIADGAAAMNTNFDTAAQRFDQIVNSGTLMARSLTSIGLNVNDVASAMGVLGVPVATLNTAFKDMDEAQRAAILSMAELTKNAGDAAKAASGVAGAWNTVKNAWESALQEMGKQTNGFQGLAEVISVSIKAIETVFSALMIVVNEVSNGIALAINDTITSLKTVANVVADVVAGNFARIPADIKAGTDQIDANFKLFQANAVAGWQNFSGGVAAAWGSAATTVAASTEAVLTPMQAAGSYAQRLATEFVAVARGFASGKLTASEYTAALEALNKAQMDANNGLQNAGTALLMIQNAFRQMNVAVANAATNVAATAAAVDAGTASWTQYVSALNALNTAQMAASGGLQDLGTAIDLADVALEKAAIDLVNAQTNLKAVNIAVENGTAGFLQHVAAVNAVQQAYLKLGAGIMDASTAFQQAIDNQQLANISFVNLTIQVDAAYAAWKQTGQGLQQYLDLVAKLPGANQNASNGLIDQATALEMVTADQIKLNNAMVNANTMLAAAGAALDKGSINLNQYEKYVTAAKAAQDALNGSTKDAAESGTVAAAAITKVGTAAQGAASATVPLINDMFKLNGTWVDMTGVAEDLVTQMQKINGTWVDMSATTGSVVDGMEKINGTWVDMNSGASSAATDLQVVNGQLVNIAGSAPGAAAGLNAVAAAAKNVGGSGGIGGIGGSASAATGQVKTLADEINAMDKAAVDAFDSLNGASLSLTLGANSLISRANPSSYESEGGLGNSMPLLPGQQPYNTTQEIINSTATMGTVVKAAAAAVTDLTTAVTAATPVVVTNYNEFGQLTDAAGHVISTLQPLATAAINVTGAYDDMSTAVTAAVSATDASTAAINALNTGAMAAATSIAMIGTATDPFVAYLTGIGHILGVGGSQGTPVIGPLNTPYVVPTGGANGGVGGPNSALNPGTYTSHPINLNVNLSGSVLTGANGMQQLQQQLSVGMVNQLARMGIRMTRG
jgi:trimeric autotransporter adhesin